MIRLLREGVIPALLFTTALVLYLRHVQVPRVYVQDEHYHAYTAGQYVAGNHDAYLWQTKPPRPKVAYTWNHPPAGLLLIALGIELWGDNSYGWRFASTVFGAAGIVVVYFLALRLTRDRGIALLGAGLLMLDGLYFVHSRIGMLDIFVTVFTLSALLAFYAYLTAPADRARARLVWSGIFLGLAIATKWNAVYAGALLGLVAIARAAGHWRQGDRREFRLALGHIALGLVALPAAVYLTTYVPFFLTGHGLGDFIELHNQIVRYHTGLRATHGYSSPWWQWPLVLRPVWYHVTYAPGTVANIYALPNPLLYWAFLPAVAWLAWSWRKVEPAALTVLLIGFFGQWVPWAAVSRVAFSYYFLPAAPFGVIAVAAAVGTLWGGGRVRQALAASYVAAVAVAFIFFHPVYAGIPLTREAFAHRVWLPGWR